MNRYFFLFFITLISLSGCNGSDSSPNSHSPGGEVSETKVIISSNVDEVGVPAGLTVSFFAQVILPDNSTFETDGTGTNTGIGKWSIVYQPGSDASINPNTGVLATGADSVGEITVRLTSISDSVWPNGAYEEHTITVKSAIVTEMAISSEADESGVPAGLDVSFTAQATLSDNSTFTTDGTGTNTGLGKWSIVYQPGSDASIAPDTGVLSTGLDSVGEITVRLSSTSDSVWPNGAYKDHTITVNIAECIEISGGVPNALCESDLQVDSARKRIYGVKSAACDGYGTIRLKDLESNTWYDLKDVDSNSPDWGRVGISLSDSGELYAVDSDLDQLWVRDTSGTWTDISGGTNAPSIYPLSSTVAVDDINEKLYVALRTSVKVKDLVTGNWTNLNIPYDTQLISSIHVDDLGNIYVSDSSLDRVLKYDTLKEIWDIFYQSTSGVARLSSDSSGYIYMTDSAGKVLKLDSLGDSETIEKYNGWNSPSGLDIDLEGNIYIQEWHSGEIFMKLP